MQGGPFAYRCPYCGAANYPGSTACVQCARPIQQQQPAFVSPVARDEAEWKVTSGWMWVLSLIGAVLTYHGARLLTLPTNDFLPGIEGAFGWVFLLLGAGLLSFAGMRLRRLYRYDAPHRTGWKMVLAACLALLAMFVMSYESRISPPAKPSGAEPSVGIRDVHAGMTMPEVREILGAPDDVTQAVTSHGPTVAWWYTRDRCSVLFGPDGRVISAGYD